MWVQLQITKYCITNISAHLLLSKHRHSKKPTGTKSQQVTSQEYLQSKDIDRILINYFCLRSTCRCEIQNNTNLSCQNNGGKVGKPQNSSIFLKRREQNSRKFARIQQNAGQQAQSKVTYPNFAPLGSSASIQKISTFEPFASFLLF